MVECWLTQGQEPDEKNVLWIEGPTGGGIGGHWVPVHFSHQMVGLVQFLILTQS